MTVGIEGIKNEPLEAQSVPLHDDRCQTTDIGCQTITFHKTVDTQTTSSYNTASTQTIKTCKTTDTQIEVKTVDLSTQTDKPGMFF